jgi:hypothetical protein
MSTLDQSVWMERKAAARILKVPVEMVNRFVEDGLIRERKVPRIRARYHAGDIRSLAADWNAPPAPRPAT